MTYGDNLKRDLETLKAMGFPIIDPSTQPPVDIVEALDRIEAKLDYLLNHPALKGWTYERDMKLWRDHDGMFREWPPADTPR